MIFIRLDVPSKFLLSFVTTIHRCVCKEKDNHLICSPAELIIPVCFLQWITSGSNDVRETEMTEEEVVPVIIPASDPHHGQFLISQVNMLCVCLCGRDKEQEVGLLNHLSLDR